MSNNFAADVRKWISRSEASDSELPPMEHRLPEGWDEEDIIVDSDIAPIVVTAASPKKQAPPPAPITTTAGATTTTAQKQHTEVSSPGVFPDGFFASPKSKKPAGDFPTTTTTAASPKKFNQAEEDARLKTDAAPGLLSRLTGFFMKKQDGTSSSSSSSAKTTATATAPVAVDAASPSPKKLTGARREREESSSSSSSSEEDITTGGDLQTQLVSMTLKQLEKSSITIGDLKEYAKENNVAFNSKTKKGELIAACRDFAKKAANKNAAAASSPSKPRAVSSTNSTGAVAASPSAAAATATTASPTKAAASVASPQKAQQQQQPKKKLRVIDTKRLSGVAPTSISKNDEPQEEWLVVQMREWAKDNKVDLSNLFLRTQILQKCWEAYDAKH